MQVHIAQCSDQLQNQGSGQQFGLWHPKEGKIQLKSTGIVLEVMMGGQFPRSLRQGFSAGKGDWEWYQESRLVRSEGVWGF